MELPENAKQHLIKNIFSNIDKKRSVAVNDISNAGFTKVSRTIDAGYENCPAVLSVTYIYYPIGLSKDHQSSFSIIFYLVNGNKRYRIVNRNVMLHVLGQFLGWCKMTGTDAAL